MHSFEKARELHYRLFPMMKAIFQEGNPSGVKASMNIQAWIENVLRLPLIPANQGPARQNRPIGCSAAAVLIGWPALPPAWLIRDFPAVLLPSGTRPAVTGFVFLATAAGTGIVASHFLLHPDGLLYPGTSIGCLSSSRGIIVPGHLVFVGLKFAEIHFLGCSCPLHTIGIPDGNMGLHQGSHHIFVDLIDHGGVKSSKASNL
jgi:hypothetical protein